MTEQIQQTESSIRRVIDTYNPINQRVFSRPNRFLEDFVRDKISSDRQEYDSLDWKGKTIMGTTYLAGLLGLTTYAALQATTRLSEASIIAAGKTAKAIGRAARRGIDHLAAKYDSIRKTRDSAQRAGTAVQEYWGESPIPRKAFLIACAGGAFALFGKARSTDSSESIAPQTYTEPWQRWFNNAGQRTRRAPPVAGELPQFNDRLIVTSVFQETDAEQPDFYETVRYFMRESQNRADPQISSFNLYLTNGERVRMIRDGRNFMLQHDNGEFTPFVPSDVVAYDVREDDVRHIGLHNARLRSSADRLLSHILDGKNPDVMHFRGHTGFYVPLACAQEAHLVYLGGCNSYQYESGGVLDAYQNAQLVLTRERMDWLENHRRIRHIAEAINAVRRNSSNAAWQQMSDYGRREHGAELSRERMRLPGDT